MWLSISFVFLWTFTQTCDNFKFFRYVFNFENFKNSEANNNIQIFGRGRVMTYEYVISGDLQNEQKCTRGGEGSIITEYYTTQL